MANYNITPCSGSTSIVVDFQAFTPVVSKVYYIYFTGLTAPSCYTVDSVTGATAVDGISSISNANDDCITCTGCTCHYVNVTIVQNEIDAASGNTGPNAVYNGVVSVSYTNCNNNPDYKDYTVAGSYPDDLCVLASSIYSLTNIIYYYQDDNLITSEYPYSGSSVFDTGSCCLDSTPTPTPTITSTVTPTVTSSETPTPTPTITSTVTPTNTETITPTVTPTNTETPTPTISETPTTTPTITNTPSPTPCLDTNWITWTGASGGTFSLIGGGTVTLTSSSTGATYSQPVFQYSRLSCPDKNPSGNVQALENEGLYTYTFSQPVANPVLAVYTLGRDLPSPITASLSADTAFTVYCSATSNPSYALTYDLLNQSFSGTEGYGIVEFVGTVTSITLNYLPFEQYTQLSWGIPCVGLPATTTPTPTPTLTPSNTPSITPSVTPSNTTSALPFDIYTFRECCDTTNIFRFSFVPGSMTVGQVFYVDNSLDFEGCAEVIPYEATGPIYLGSSVIFTEQTSCEDAFCPPCPTPTSTPIIYCANCFDYNIYNDNTFDVWVQYTDCLGNDESIFVPQQTTIGVCACEDTVIAPDLVYVTYVGTCPTVTATPQPTPTNTPTPSVTPTVGWNYCPVEEYCLLTYFPETEMYDGTYYSAGTYSGRTYYSGDSAVIYYGDLQWCLSDTLGGDCILSGSYPYYGVCPDLCGDLFSSGTCVTTTSTTNPCNVFDFEAYFDCDVSTTTTTTIPCSATSVNVTFSAYTTTTTTANPCVGVGGSITISGYTTTTTTAPTTTTTTTTRDVVVSGDVTYTLVQAVFVCPGQTYWFQDCTTLNNYYVEPSTAFNSIDLFINYVYDMDINGNVSCYTFMGTSTISPNAIFNDYTNWYLDCATCQS